MSSWSHKRPEEAQKGRESRGYRLQGLGGGCWKLGSHTGCKGACGEKNVFETLTSEVHERQKYTGISKSEKQKGIVDLGVPAGPRKSTVELGPELMVPFRMQVKEHGQERQKGWPSKSSSAALLIDT